MRFGDPVPRPLLEIWRELNSARDREPSSLLQQALGIGRKPLSFTEQAIAKMMEREQSRQMLARAIRQPPLSPMQQFEREMSSPEMQEKLRRRQEFLKACGVTERVLGTPRPVPPVQPAQPEHNDAGKKRKAGGRPHRLTQDQIDTAISTVRNKRRQSVNEMRKALAKGGIKASRSTIYRHIYKKVHPSR